MTSPVLIREEDSVMIRIDLLDDARYKSRKLFPPAFAAVDRNQLKDFKKGEFYFFDSLPPERREGFFERGFYVTDIPVTWGLDKTLFLRAFFCSITNEWGVVWKKNRRGDECLYFFDSDNVLDYKQTHDDFILTGLSIMSYSVFEDKFYKGLLVDNDKGEVLVPFYIFTIPVPIGFCVRENVAYLVYALFINLPPREHIKSSDKNVSMFLKNNYYLTYYKQDADSMKETVYNVVRREFFKNEPGEPEF